MYSNLTSIENSMKRIIKTINLNSIDHLDQLITDATSGVFPFLILIYESQENSIPLSSVINSIHSYLPKTIARIIPQRLLSCEFTICLELHCFSQLPDRVEYYQSETVNGNVAYFGEAAFCSAISTSKEVSKYSRCFEYLSEFLSSFSMSFNDVIRQWNYIPNIIGYNDDGAEEYALFNSARAKAYSEAKMQLYPAATGIGVCGAEAIIIILAQKHLDEQVHAVENPLQISAYNYSDNVLNTIKNRNTCPKPLFSRGLAIVADNIVNDFYISGTASIRGEATIGTESLREQTTKTIDNINNLISSANIHSATKLSNIGNLTPTFLRVYLKNATEEKIAKELIISSYPQATIILLHADICRENLLIEIEGLV